MVEGSVPQWILTHPMTKAPRTGDGLFPGEVVEVTQVSLSVCQSVSQSLVVPPCFLCVCLSCDLSRLAPQGQESLPLFRVFGGSCPASTKNLAWLSRAEELGTDSSHFHFRECSVVESMLYAYVQLQKYYTTRWRYCCIPPIFLVKKRPTVVAPPSPGILSRAGEGSQHGDGSNYYQCFSLFSPPLRSQSVPYRGSGAPVSWEVRICSVR